MALQKRIKKRVYFDVGKLKSKDEIGIKAGFTRHVVRKHMGLYITVEDAVQDSRWRQEINGAN
jgi:hypothetical protein